MEYPYKHIAAGKFTSESHVKTRPKWNNHTSTSQSSARQPAKQPARKSARNRDGQSNRNGKVQIYVGKPRENMFKIDTFQYSNKALADLLDESRAKGALTKIGVASIENTQENTCKTQSEQQRSQQTSKNTNKVKI